MRLVNLLVIACLWLPARAQGPHPVGFSYATLYNDSLPYSAFGYNGPAPLFLQIWHPLNETPDTPPLTYRELRLRRVPEDLERVYDALTERMDSAFIEYDLRYATDGETPLAYTPYGIVQVKDSLFDLPTRAHRARIGATGERSVILYHHGSQGMSDENVRMAENFASHGYVFLSSNFHWPLEGAPYGTPLVWEPDRTTIGELLRHARQLSNGGKVFYIGHSWGAQEGWCTLYEPGLADAFVSLETTLEWKTDTAEVRDKWPHVLQALLHQRYALPILLAADPAMQQSYHFFRGVSPRMTYASPVGSLAHEGFTSAWFLRSHAPAGVPVPDKAALEAQQRTYEALLDTILDFLRNVERGAFK